MSKQLPESARYADPGSRAVSPLRSWPDMARGSILPLLKQTAVWIALVDLLLFGVFGLLSPAHVFFGTSSLQNITLSAAQIVVLSGAASFELAAGEIDISLGAILVLSSILGGEAMMHLAGSDNQVANGVYPHLATALIVGVVVVLLGGALLGLINGLVVTRLGVNSFIATLAMAGVAAGTGYIITNGADLAYIPTSLQVEFGARLILGIPAPALAVAIIMAVLWAVLKFTRFGLHTLALGSSREAAERAGVPVKRHVVAVFILAGLIAGFAGLLDLSRFATTNIAGHTTDALAAVAGAVIGGTSLFGGRASIVGTVFGALLAVILQTGLITIGLTPFYQQIAIGVILVAAVHLDQRRKEHRM
jgi:ribose transport system permease protein